MAEDKIDEISLKYKKLLSESLGTKNESSNTEFVEPDKTDPIRSQEFEEFKNEYLPAHFSIYEKCCNLSEKALRIKPDPKKEEEIKKAIDICHLNVTPSGVLSFAVLGPLLFVLIGAPLGYLLSYMLNPYADGSMFFIIFVVITGAALILPLLNLPDFLATQWRLKASNQMVLSVFYMVTYMRHTSNLELAVEFASEHLSPPLSVDLRKVLWNVETGKFESIKDSLEDYLQTWRDWNKEFIESVHLIESSLYEPSEDRRIEALEKSLTLILDETYEKMLHYAHNLKGPITMLHMLGVIMPILGLVILPLMVSFMEGIEWYHIAMFYNIALPIMVYYIAKKILSKRPTGYGQTDISEKNPAFKKYKNIYYKFGKTEVSFSPLYVSITIGVVFCLIGLIPILMHVMNPDPSYDYEIEGFGKLLDYKQHRKIPGKIIGPFGIGATILSVFIPIGIGVGIGSYYSFRSKNMLKIREETKKLEEEFATALFQLGNRLADGLPLETAIQKVAMSMENTTAGNFFRDVSTKVTKLGISVEAAIFDPRFGVLTDYPSPLIESSMKVLNESAKKGPRVASNALINISRYIKEIHRVNERLNDLMADTISSMKSQISFLTPVISGIVVGITAMITLILNTLTDKFTEMGAGGSEVPMGNLLEMFSAGTPTYYFQIVVGIYVVQIVFILTILLNGIENGADKLMEEYMIGANMVKTTLLYCVLALIVTLMFNTLAGSILSSLG